MTKPLISHGLADEEFAMWEHGWAVNVAGIIDFVNDEETIELSSGETERLAKELRRGNVNAEGMARVTPARLEEPLIVAALFDELWVIDGNHRLEARLRAGLPRTELVLLMGEVLRPFLRELNPVSPKRQRQLELRAKRAQAKLDGEKP